MATQEMPAGPTCPRCGTANDPRVFCLNCGLFLRDESGMVERVTYNRRFFGSYLLEGVLAVLTLFIGWLIWFAFQAPKAQTPAKSLTNLYVVSLETGRAATTGEMWLREVIIKIIVVSLVPFGWLIDGIWVFFDGNRQALHDKILNQVVVYAPQGLPAAMLSLQSAGAAPSLPPPTSAGSAPDIASQLRELSRLHDEHILTDDEYEQKRSELAGKL